MENVSTHILVELESLVHLAREAVDEEAAAAVCPALVAALLACLEGLAHRVLEQLDRDLHGHDLALLDVGTNDIPVFGAFSVLLCPQEIASCLSVSQKMYI